VAWQTLIGKAQSRTGKPKTFSPNATPKQAT